VCNLRDDN